MPINKKDAPTTATVLVIDDDQSIRDAIREGLSEAMLLKIAVLEAEDVETGLQMTLEHRPNVIILDLSFDDTASKHGGFDFLKQIRSNEKLKQTKIMVLTAHDTLENMRLAEDLDVSAYNFVGKPFELSELIAQVYSLVFD